MIGLFILIFFPKLTTNETLKIGVYTVKQEVYFMSICKMYSILRFQEFRLE